MKKLNKKGFTLIEMLVVIAIIAILVAIIIPTVTSATKKAAGATNAANLRSYKAEIATSFLAGDGKVTVANDGTVTIDSTITAPTLKPIDSTDYTVDTVTYEDGDFKVTAGGKTIDDFAGVAETGSFPSASETP